jgi:hypothetical protein
LQYNQNNIQIKKRNSIFLNIYLRWDEWITEDRVLKYTDNNLQKQQQLKEMNTKRKPSRASSTTGAVSTSAASTPHEAESRGRKRNHDATTEKTKTVNINDKHFMGKSCIKWFFIIIIIILGGRDEEIRF